MVSAHRFVPPAALLAAAVVGLLAVVAPSMALVASVGLAFVVITLVDLSLGVCLFVFAACFFEAVPELNSVSVAKVIGLVVAISWIAGLSLHRSWNAQLFTTNSVVSVLLILLTTWSMASALWAVDPGEALSSTVRIALNALLVPIVFSAIADGAQLRRLLTVFAVGLLGSTMYGLLVAGPDPNAPGRLAGAGLDPNYLALWLVVGAALVTGVAARRRMDPAARVAVLLIGIACVALVFPTASRTGLVSLAAVAVAAPIVLGPGRRVVAAVSVTLLVAGGAAYLMLLAPAEIVERIFASDDGGSGRTDIWMVAGRMIADNPITGVGLGNLPQELVRYLFEPGSVRFSENIIDFPKVAHNTYLGLFAELGIVGVSLYVGLIVGAITVAMRSARDLRLQGRHDDELLMRGIVLALVAMAAGATFVSLEFTKPLWLLIALGLVGARISSAGRGRPG